ncbi:MAG: class I SAM-dependent RNA methyltransferase [Vicinamibacterales bacterium]
MEIGRVVRLSVEKPAAGGRMLARHEGAVVLVAGAIPGETVDARIEKVQRGTVWAETQAVLEASADRVDDQGGGPCGGNVYGHIAYLRQVALKAEIIADAFGRIGRLPLDAPPSVLPSTVDGYRMRARLHVRRGRIGFFREGSHDLCDAAATRQLLPSTIEVMARLEAVLRELPRAGVTEVELSENRDANERALHLEYRTDGDPSRLGAASHLTGLTGVSAAPFGAKRAKDLWGSPVVAEMLAVPGVPDRHVRLERHARAFFQGNRHLLDTLVATVSGHVPDGPVLDLYAGVGLFAVTLAGAGRQVVAVESDPVAAADLRRNGAALEGSLVARHLPVEAFDASRTALTPGTTVLVDPPRTGMSREAMDVVLALGAARLVYVSCDVATLGRDARRLVDAGYRLTSVQGLDLFPNTAHVETVAVFDR